MAKRLGGPHQLLTLPTCADDPLASKVCDDDHHHLDPLHPKIDVTKDGPATAHVGDTVTYTFAVTNPGDVVLHDVGISDAKCDAAPKQTGGDANSDSLLQTTETWAFTCDHKVTAGDPDPLPNTVTAAGTDPLDLKVTDTADHSVDLIHPAITVVKSGPATAGPGQVVTYSFKVTNTGDTALTNVTVKDDKLGDVGVIAALAVGQSQTLTKDFTVPAGTAAVDNTATVCGADPLSLQVCANDVHHLAVAQVLGESFQRGPLAVTGSDEQRRLLGGLAILLAGIALAFARRRRHA